jgi:serine/threonine protein kinase
MLECHTIIDFSAVRIRRLIGKGSTSKVYQGLFQNMDVAIKQLVPKEIDSFSIGECSREATLLASLKHRNIVKFYGLCIDPPHFCLIFELCQRGSLTAHLKAIGDWALGPKLDLIISICEIVEYLHTLNPPIVHRDIKPDNFLLRKDWTPCLSDFGVSKAVVGPLQTVVGSPLWMAPELFDGKIVLLIHFSGYLCINCNCLLEGKVHDTSVDVYRYQ